ncbi:MAG: restriction endonuclease subunit S [Oscillospiraceae bacterium]|jgi:hypothetical protein|nr:restriction endonuclease subunit S [Oscillospiraceae bacterium]
MKVKDMFNVKYGVNLELLTLEIVSANEKDGVNFVARTADNNGVVARVRKIDGIEPQQAGVLSCAGGGSVLSTFVQKEPFYSGRDLYTLTPKKGMTLQEKLYWCMCIKANAYKYTYGRQANKTLKDIELPDSVPAWVLTADVTPVSTKHKAQAAELCSFSGWAEFPIGEFFTVKRGKRIVRERDYFSQPTEEYRYNVITSTKQNNGVDGYYHSYNCPANSIVCGGEAGGMFTTYQSSECWVMDRARIFKPKSAVVNKYVAIFLATVFSQNQYKYSYGRTPNPKGIESTLVKLPATAQGSPDWDYMEQYIKSLPYSDRL